MMTARMMRTVMTGMALIDNEDGNNDNDEDNESVIDNDEANELDAELDLESRIIKTLSFCIGLCY